MKYAVAPESVGQLPVRTVARIAALFAILLSSWHAVRADELPVRAQQEAFRAALAAAAPSIVRIETIGGAQPIREEGEERGVGFRTADGSTTGIIWSADGLILSSTFNFVRDPSVITVTLSDGRRLIGKLIARDHQSRLALLKVDAKELPAAVWVPPAELRTGQWAIAAGFGQGSREPAMSVGIVSGLNRMSGQCVQTDAKTSPANYGGPLLDVEGRFIGVCVPMGTGEDEFAGVDQYDSGIGFAVHADHIRRRMPRLSAGESLRRGLLGLELDLRDPVVGGVASRPSDSPPILVRGAPPQRELPPRPDDGLLILADTRGPAAEAGLEKDDVILQVDGMPTVRLLDFRRIIARKAAGDEVTVKFRHGDSEKEASMKLWSADDFRPSSQPASQPK